MIAGAAYIAKLVRTKPSLSVLTLGKNNLGDDGIAAIAKPLGKSTIDSLEFDECGITVLGAKVLAKSLLINKSITRLDMLNNPITLQGAHMILQSAVGNGICSFVLIDKLIYTDDDEARLMIETLQVRERKRHLKVDTFMYR